jgi:hypothetical protein
VRSVLLIFLVFCVVILCVFTFLVPFCEVRYDFRIKTIFGSSFPLVLCWEDRVLFTLFVFVCVLVLGRPTHNILCFFVLCVLVSCLVCPMLLVLSGLSVLDCPIGFLYRLFNPTPFYFLLYQARKVSGQDFSIIF